MSEFKSTLDARLLPECPGIEQWSLLAPLIYQSDILGEITIPAGFITDFVSMKFLNFTAHRPAVVHDFLYSCSNVDRAVADRVLKEALIYICEDYALVEEMYLAVRAFGGSHRAEKDLKYTLGQKS